jgi:hypothetical protein
LKNEDPEVFDVFLDFLVRIERNLHYLEKQEYINLAKDFLDDQIPADNFSYSFHGYLWRNLSKTRSNEKS